MSTTKNANESQHAKLRKRLEEELSIIKSASDSADYDWFLRGSSLKHHHHDHDQTASSSAPVGSTTNNPSKPTSTTSTTTAPDTSLLPPITPLKSPTLYNSPNNKAPPTVAPPSDTDFTVNLARSRTADARLITPISRTTSSTSATSSSLHRTATNVETSDIGHSRYKKPHTPSAVNTAPLSPPSEKKKRGFLKKLFGSKSEDSKPEAHIYKTTSGTTAPVTASNNISRTTSHTKSRSSSISSQHRSQHVTPLTQTTPSINTNVKSRTSSISVSSPVNHHNSVSRASTISKVTSNNTTKTFSSSSSSENKSSLPDFSTMTLAEQYKEIDPQLSSYLDEIETSNIKTENELADEQEKDYNYIYSPSGIEKIKYKTEEIPPHPDQPKLPSAFSTKPKYGDSLEKELFLKHKKEREEKESSMFGSLLHKTKTTTPESLFYNGMINESEDTPPFSFEPLNYQPPPPKIDKRPPLEAFTDVKPMKKVAFATTTFVTDPPQQIPSRNPRKGNVEICANGELIIHKIDPQEKINAATGIVVGGSGPLRLIAETNPEERNLASAESSNLQIDVPNAASMQPSASVMSNISTASQSTQDHTIRKEDKILAAKKAREHNDSLEKIDTQKEGLKIDKPMVRRKKQMEKPVVTLKMDELYTRCCHLREILPIPATLKQIPKGSTDPIPYLHLRNPRPSMIEILSFTDFIRIAPVICVSLDGVSLTREMFRIVLSSLLYKRYLEKLSLRNTPIDEEGWKMLSLFLSMNKALRKLDLTQCPTLDVNTQRIKKKSKTATENRMVCNVNDRSDANWALLTASLIYRGGIDEIILTGCKIPDLKLFANILNLALVKTSKIGLAYNELTLQHCYVVSRWLQSNPTVIGIDLAYNDLSSKLKPFIEYANDSDSTNNLMMISLNSCNLIDCVETDTFFNVLSKLQRLAYLDISGNSKLMKTFLRKLTVYLPLLHNLARLHIDNNQLDEKSMVMLLECVPLMANLNYLSIIGNEMNDTVSQSLCKALKNSKTLYSVAFDEALVNREDQERIGLLTMRNVERQLYKKREYQNKETSFLEMIAPKDREKVRKDLGLSENASFTDALYSLVKAKHVDDAKLEKFLGCANQVCTSMQQVIQTLVNSNAKNELSLQGKEMLIRLITMKASVDKALELINNKKLNTLKKDLNFDLSQYKSLDFEHSGQSNPLDSIINDLKSKGLNDNDALKNFIMSTNDPYALISLLKRCKANNITISDLFLKRYSEDGLSSNSRLPDSIDDDASIDSIELEEEAGTTSPTDNCKILQIYDLILKDLVSQSKK